jgi:hypothetical protein
MLRRFDIKPASCDAAYALFGAKSLNHIITSLPSFLSLSTHMLSPKNNVFFCMCYRLNSVVIAENGDYDIPDQKFPPDCQRLLRETSSYDSVQHYVNSLPNSVNRTASMLSLHSLHVTRNRSQENLLKKSNSLHTSFSMEDLLFLGWHQSSALGYYELWDCNGRHTLRLRGWDGSCMKVCCRLCFKWEKRIIHKSENSDRGMVIIYRFSIFMKAVNLRIS